MKKFYVLSIVACFALAANAQVKFTLVKDSPLLIADENTSTLYCAHRATPLVADIDNDGHMDAVYGGTSWTHNWQTTTAIMYNLGDGNILVESERLWEDFTYTEVDEDGNEVEKQGQREIGVASGFPKFAYGIGSRVFDFDNDGLLDFLVLNMGGNDTGSEKELMVVRNLGNRKFEKVPCEDLYACVNHGNNDKWNEQQQMNCLQVNDYDHDGYPDILFEDMGVNGRVTKLFHNEGGKTFKEVHPVKPIALDKEINPLYLYEKGEDVYDEDGIKLEDGEITDVPTGDFKPMTNGSALFCDFNNDGWADIVTNGWNDGNDTYPGGNAIRFYKNLQDGTFQDISDIVAENCNIEGGLLGLMQRWGSSDGCFYPFDYNQDGKIDLFFTGGQDSHGGGKSSYVLLNSTEKGGDFSFEETATTMIPLSGSSFDFSYFFDLNGDDYVDGIRRGWTDWGEIYNWTNVIEESQNSETYENHINDWNDIITGAFGAEFSPIDFNGDGKIDLMGSTWNDRGEQAPEGGDAKDYVFIYQNDTDYEVVLPEAPTNVSAKMEDGKVTVTWDESQLPISGNKALYNVYLKNKETGAVRMLNPHSIETGVAKAYCSFCNYVLTDEDPAYTFCNVPAGNYEVGVQTVTYSYVASSFAKADVVASGIGHIEAATAAPEYFTLDGRRADANAKGVVIVRQGGNVMKMMR